MRILIIECDEPIEELKEQFGDYKTYFATLLESASEGKLEFEALSAYKNVHMPADNEMEALKKRISGIVISGSRHNSYDNTPWILNTLKTIKAAYEHGIKMAGICFGHQLIARALGGEVALNPAGWEIAVTTTKIDSSVGLFPSMEVLRLQQMHRDYVSKAPPGCTVFLSNDNCAIQGMYMKDRYISVQGHPEFNQTTVETLVDTRVKLGIVPEEYGRDAFARAKDPHDGVIVAKAILKLFE